MKGWPGVQAVLLHKRFQPVAGAAIALPRYGGPLDGAAPGGAGSEDIGQIEEDDDGDGNTDHPGENAFHGRLLSMFGEIPCLRMCGLIRVRQEQGRRGWRYSAEAGISNLSHNRRRSADTAPAP